MGNRVISFGKVDGYGRGRKNCEVTAVISLMNIEWGLEFAAYAKVWNNLHTDSIMFGQCLESTLEKYEKDLKENGTLEEFKILLDIWKKHHLNDMHAGTIEQEEALLEHFGNMDASQYKEHCEYLKSIGLYEIPWTDELKVSGYKDKKHPDAYQYGSGWIYREISEKDLEKINKIIDKGMKGLREISLEEKEMETPEEEPER